MKVNTARQPLFLYSNGPRGSVLYCRALYRAVVASGCFDLVIGACRDDAVLLQDLTGPQCRTVASDFANTPHGAVLDLDYLNPDGRPAIAVWLGGTEEKPSYQWADVVEAFHRDLRRLGIATRLEVDVEAVPMLDFAGEIVVPKLQRPAIYLDCVRAMHEPCHFVYDFERLCDVLPEHDLLCTGPVDGCRDALVDIGALSPLQRSRLSEQCDVLIGTTMDPFLLTFTEANRWKPKALCGYDARRNGPLWDYAGNPLELLATMDDLVDFLLANVSVGGRR